MKSSPSQITCIQIKSALLKSNQITRLHDMVTQAAAQQPGLTGGRSASAVRYACSASSYNCRLLNVRPTLMWAPISSGCTLHSVVRQRFLWTSSPSVHWHCMGHDHSCPGSQGQGQRLKVRVKGRNAVGGTRSEGSSSSEKVSTWMMTSLH